MIASKAQMPWWRERDPLKQQDVMMMGKQSDCKASQKVPCDLYLVWGIVLEWAMIFFAEVWWS